MHKQEYIKNNTSEEKGAYGNDYLFQDIFYDKKIGFQIYGEQIDAASFELQLGIKLYVEDIISYSQKSLELMKGLGPVINDAAISGYHEGKNGIKKINDSINFSLRGEVSNKVFDKLGFPERVLLEGEKNKFRAYMSQFEDKKYIHKKMDYCDTFVKTNSFQGRKLLFEEIISKNIEEYSVFSGMIYTLKHDIVLRELFQSSSIYLSNFFDTISNTCYNRHELELFFDIMYQKLGSGSDDVAASCHEAEKIIIRSRKEKSSTLKKIDVEKISKTISLLKLEKIEVTFDEIQKHIGLYIKIPNILGSNHGENSASIGLINGFVMTQRPKPIRTLKKHMKFWEAIIQDSKVISPVRKKIEQGKILFNKFIKQSGVATCISGIKGIQKGFGEKKMRGYLSYQRHFNQDSLGDMDMDTHKQLMKNYFLIQKIIGDIETGLHISDGKVEHVPSSKILSFILGRGKSETIKPLASQLWIVVGRFSPIFKIFSFLPFVPLFKIGTAILLFKTAFIYTIYKLIDLGIYVGSYIPFFERYVRFFQIQGNPKVAMSPELQDLLIDNLSDIQNINRDVSKIRQLKKFQLLEQKLDKDLENDNFQENVSEESELEISLLKSEISHILESIDQKELQEEIIDFKVQYLSLLEDVGKKSTTSYLK